MAIAEEIARPEFMVGSPSGGVRFEVAQLENRLADTRNTRWFS